MTDEAPWRARVELPNSPESVAAMLHSLATHGIGVVSLFTHAQREDADQLVDMFLSAPAATAAETIERLLETTSSRVIVARGETRDAEDIATRVLYLAARLVDDPSSAPQAAALLVLANAWEVMDATRGDPIAPDVMRLQWTPDRHVILRRDAAPFTRTERDRASALLALVASAAQARGVEDEYGWSDEDTGIVTRLARPGDAEAVARMHERCSEETLFERYFAPVGGWRADQLRRISGGHRGATLVVLHEDRIIGLGNVFPEAPDDATVAEVALVIDDEHQGQGLGPRLLERLISLSRRLGFAQVQAYVLAENRRMNRVLAGSSVEWSSLADSGLGASVICYKADLG